MERLSTGLIARASLEANGFHTRKTLGQNFLLDDELIAGLVDGIGLTEEDDVLEIGPGPGVMTKCLSSVCRKVLSVELDRSLEKVLSRVLDGCENVEIVYQDALKADLAGLAREAFGGRPYHVVANLPYYITTDLIEKAIALPGCKSVNVMVQQEAGERLTSHVGSKQWCEAAALVALFGEARVAAEVPRDRFEPAPHVDSVFLSITPYEDTPYRPLSRATLRKTVKAAFLMRRKTLTNNLIAAFGMERGEAEEMLTSLGLDPRVRGEALELSELVRLSDAIAEKSK